MDTIKECFFDIKTQKSSIIERELTPEEISIKENLKSEEQKRKRIIEIEQRLNKLSQDFIQAMLGALFEDLEERKTEFRSLHNELRVLMMKEPRIYDIGG